MTSTLQPKQSIYEKVTSQIVAAIESGPVGSWRMPWHTTGGEAFSPINVVSRKAYRGINTLCLWATAQAKGYSSGEWGTFNQWKDKGASVRKGEKATTVVFWKFANSTKDEKGEKPETDDSGSSRLVFTRGYCVFNAAQVEGYTPKTEEVPTVEERIQSAEQFFAEVGAEVRSGGNRAFYSPSTDHIQMPPFVAFEEPVSFYSTLAHEHTHWTGTAARLDRTMGKRFGDNQYAVEELVAELGAAFVCAFLGLEAQPREDHAQYLASWLKVLKADSRAIFVAAGKAQAAADFLINAAGMKAHEADDESEEKAA